MTDNPAYQDYCKCKPDDHWPDCSYWDLPESCPSCGYSLGSNVAVCEDCAEWVKS